MYPYYWDWVRPFYCVKVRCLTVLITHFVTEALPFSLQSDHSFLLSCLILSFLAEVVSHCCMPLLNVFFLYFYFILLLFMISFNSQIRTCVQSFSYLMSSESHTVFKYVFSRMHCFCFLKSWIFGCVQPFLFLTIQNLQGITMFSWRDIKTSNI